MALVVAEEVYPDYRITQTISDLGVGQSAPIFNTSLFLQGTLTLVAAYFLYLAYRRLLVPTFFALGGIGAMGAAIFPTNVNPAHLLISIFAFLIAGLTPFVTLKIQDPPLQYLSAGIGSFSFAVAILLSLNVTSGLSFGTWERMLAYPSLLWVVGFGGYLMSSNPQHGAAEKEHS